MLIGNLCAIGAAALMGIYSSFTESIVTNDVKNFIYVHLAFNSGFMVIVTYLISIFTGNAINLFSFDCNNGLLSIFSDWYHILKSIGNMCSVGLLVLE